MFYFLLPIVIFCIFMSIRTLFIPNTIKGKFVSIENALFLGSIYLTVILGFGLIYLLFELKGISLLVEVNDENNYNLFETSFYFSAMTLFSVGNGDVIPHGLGRMVAVVEALIGYTMPAAFVARALMDREVNEIK
ncbi:potassium channel LctB [Bacillus niacini]|jgi:potassium channel LctB|uniref:Potassium channel LctB n=2 Tax=Neobacillus TaxID=2675232 RepID=A0A852THR2_9BACI|nr:potassium channel family protein [Neobacillus niacini]MDQ0973259.1 potassium channel LctB [Neobacillus niacini]NYE08292.1 potassium channel LctB [Neobacillus niacini]